jgi:hypothetical protein
MSHVERKSKYTKLAKLPDKSADAVVQAYARVLLPLADRIETITYDRLSRRDRNLAGVAILFCQTLSLVGTRPQRTHRRPIQTVLPKGFRSLYCVPCRCPKGSRINSTLAPERYSATELLVRFSSAPKISPCTSLLNGPPIKRSARLVERFFTGQYTHNLHLRRDYSGCCGTPSVDRGICSRRNSGRSLIDYGLRRLNDGRRHRSDGSDRHRAHGYMGKRNMRGIGVRLRPAEPCAGGGEAYQFE